MNSSKNTCIAAMLAAIGLWSASAAAQIAPTLDAAASDNAGVPQLQTIDLIGHDLEQHGYTTSVSFNGTSVPPEDLLELAPERIVVLVPAGTASGSVSVSVDGLTSNQLDFSVVDTVPVNHEDILIRPKAGAFVGMISGRTGLLVTRAIPLDETIWYRLHIDDGRGIAQAIRDVFETGLVDTAEALFPIEALNLPSKQNVDAPQDPLFPLPQQYGPQRIRAVDNSPTPDAFAISKGGAPGAGVRIAVVDTGIDATHEDLAGAKMNMVTGWDFVDGDNDPTDQHSHGTHVAGIASAYTNNNKGIAGIAPNAVLIAERVLDADGFGTNEWVAGGIRDAAARRGAQVINLSLGSKVPSKMIKDAVLGAIGQGAVVVAAAGNDGTQGSPPGYPAAFSHPFLPDGLIAVANSTRADGIAPSSTRGAYVDVAAPGTCILSTVPALAGLDESNGCTPYVAGANYVEYTGTSMAAPHAAGLAALMLGKDARLTPTQTECLMEIAAVDIEQEDFDIASGHGRIDAYAAVHAVMSLGGRYELLPPQCNTWQRGRRDQDGDGDGNGDDDDGFILLRAGQGRPDQVIPITSDSAVALAAARRSAPDAADSATLRIAVANDSLANEYAGVPITDTVLTPNDQYGLVVEQPGTGADGTPGTESRATVKRIRLSDNATENVVVDTPVTELTVTPDSARALLGTVRDLVILDLPTLDSARLEVDAITAVAVTPDSLTGLVGEPNGLQAIQLGAATSTLLDTGIPLAGPTVTLDGSRAVVGTPVGVAIVDPAGASVQATLASGVPVTNIALTPDDAKAVYGTTDPLDGSALIVVDLATATFVRRDLNALPVTDVDITADSARAVVGTEAGVSVLTIGTGSVANVATATPRTGLSLYPNDAWATVGIAAGILCVDPVNVTVKTFATTTRPLTNVAIAPDSSLGVVGIESGVALIDCTLTPPVPATEIAMARPVLAATVTPDSEKAVIGTVDGFHVLDLGAAAQVPVSPKPPALNHLPDDTQPPLNPSGERGRSDRSDG